MFIINFCKTVYLVADLRKPCQSLQHVLIYLKVVAFLQHKIRVEWHSSDKGCCMSVGVTTISRLGRNLTDDLSSVDVWCKQSILPEL
jgi:hypothetical protein